MKRVLFFAVSVKATVVPVKYHNCCQDNQQLHSDDAGQQCGATVDVSIVCRGDVQSERRQHQFTAGHNVHEVLSPRMSKVVRGLFANTRHSSVSRTQQDSSVSFSQSSKQEPSSTSNKKQPEEKKETSAAAADSGAAAQVSGS